MKLLIWFSSALATFAVLLLAACGKKEAEGGAPEPAAAVPDKPQAATKAHESIPGENEVRQAIASKDYNGAVQRYVALKAVVASPEQNEDYMNLYGQIRSELEDAARKDPKAAEALASFRAIRNGR